MTATIEALEPRHLCAGGNDELTGVKFDGPIVITEGGVYSGNWQSLDPDRPAVSIHTSEPVVIENSVIRGRGDLIESDYRRANVVVRNTRGYGMNPGVRGLEPGRFVELEGFRRAVIRNNDLEGTSGIYLHEYVGDRTRSETIRIIGNRALNIDGRKSNGKGGFMKFDERFRRSTGEQQKGYERVQFVQFNDVNQIRHARIAWNQVINEPGKSRVEDNINIYNSSGTRRSPIRIHDNYIHGAYTIRPGQESYSNERWEYDWDYAGGGILLGDGERAAHVEAFDNQVVSTTNHGIAIAVGHHLRIRDNRVLSSGKLPDGTDIFARNVGIYIWDADDTGPDRFYANTGRDNRVGWIGEDGRNDWWVPNATSFTSRHWPGTITVETEAAERQRWERKLDRAGRTVGVTSVR